MIKIMFVCLGNICRSPMAEFIMKDYVHKAHLDQYFTIASSATDDYNIYNGHGSPVYPQAKRQLKMHHIDCHGKQAQLLTRADYRTYDYLIGMDASNIDDMRYICGGDPQHKIARLLDYTNEPRDVADPWYTGNFDLAYKDIARGCQALLTYLRQQHHL